MSENQNIKNELEKMLYQKRNKAYYAYKLGITENEVSKLLKELPNYSKKTKEEKDDTNESIVLKFFENITKVNNEKGTLESKLDSSFAPKNDIELAELHKVDLEKYKISSYWTKQKPDGTFSSSLLASLKKPEDISSEDIIELLENYTSSYQPIKKGQLLINDIFTREVCAFIDITDFHIDKRDIYETPIETKISEYYTLLDRLLYRAYQSNTIDEIVFVVGSDMLHTDNFFNQTTKFTPQETTVRWNEAFEIAFDIYVNSINKLKQFCKTLNVILVAGNHSRTKEYYLSFALKKYFENDINIKFDISTSPRKIYCYGNTFIGLHHGNTKIETLPIIFSKEFTKEWGNALYHEIKIGDKHHYMEKDYSGVRIKQLPACTNPDTWHNDNNYVTSVQSAICSIYDKEKGRCMDIEERL